MTVCPGCSRIITNELWAAWDWELGQNQQSLLSTRLFPVADIKWPICDILLSKKSSQQPLRCVSDYLCVQCSLCCQAQVQVQVRWGSGRSESGWVQLRELKTQKYLPELYHIFRPIHPLLLRAQFSKSFRFYLSLTFVQVELVRVFVNVWCHPLPDPATPLSVPWSVWFVSPQVIFCHLCVRYPSPPPTFGLLNPIVNPFSYVSDCGGHRQCHNRTAKLSDDWK